MLLNLIYITSEALQDNTYMVAENYQGKSRIVLNNKCCISLTVVEALGHGEIHFKLAFRVSFDIEFFFHLWLCFDLSFILTFNIKVLLLHSMYLKFLFHFSLIFHISFFF